MSGANMKGKKEKKENETYADELRMALETAVRAGSIVMPYYHQGNGNGGKGVIMKENNTPVTIADVLSSNFIISEIKKDFPLDGIVSEEDHTEHPEVDKPAINTANYHGVDDSGVNNLSAQRAQYPLDARCWYIDPIDGTKSFINRMDHFAIHIGLCVGTEPVLGVVYQPATAVMYYAVKGQGAYRINPDKSIDELVLPDRAAYRKDDRKDGYRDDCKDDTYSSESLDHNPVGIFSQNWDEECNVKRYLRQMDVKRTLRSGSQGLRMMKIVEGVADINFSENSMGCNAWDVCAPQAIVEEAGGQVMLSNGERIAYTGQDDRLGHRILVANTRRNMEKMLGTIR